MNEAPFTPGPTVLLAVTAASARVPFGAGTGTVQVLVTCPSTVTGITFLKFGDVTVNAAVTDTPILPGTVQIMTVPNNATHVAAISGGAGGTMYFTIGHGV